MVEIACGSRAEVCGGYFRKTAKSLKLLAEVVAEVVAEVAEVVSQVIEIACGGCAEVCGSLRKLPPPYRGLAPTAGAAGQAPTIGALS